MVSLDRTILMAFISMSLIHVLYCVGYEGLASKIPPIYQRDARIFMWILAFIHPFAIAVTIFSFRECTVTEYFPALVAMFSVATLIMVSGHILRWVLVQYARKYQTCSDLGAIIVRYCRIIPLVISALTILEYAPKV